MAYMLLFSVFVIATCGLVYELISGTVASYLLGDSVTQFSTVIGVYLFSMGVGSFLSRYINKNILMLFVQVELLIGLIGGFSAALLFFSFAYVDSFRVVLYTVIGFIGVLVGIEIPLLMRILKEEFEFKELVSRIFTFDYIGALLASLLFPLFLVPHLGLLKTSFLFGMLNIAVALWCLLLFKDKVPWRRPMQTIAIAILVLLGLGFAYSDRILSSTESATYPDKVIYASSSPYQRIVLTQNHDDLRLFLNGNLQFSSRDEYRYHEALVHVGMGSIASPKKILVLGGGDGMAIRELLKYPSVEDITLVDLDHAVVDLFSHQKKLSELNHQSFSSEKVHVIQGDAFVWLRKNQRQFDFIVVDFPDPSNYSIGKLYSTTFYGALRQALKPQGALVIQSTSPYYAKESFWCVVNTLKAVGLVTLPYHAYVPSFGDWGYILASKTPLRIQTHYPHHLRYITPEIINTLVTFPQDMRSKNHLVNRLNNQVLVQHFEQEWSRYVSAE